MLDSVHPEQSTDLRKTRRKKMSLADPSRIDRLPPHSIEAEQGVLGCVMLSPNDVLGECIEKFKSGVEVFYDLRHQEIFKALLEMWEKKDAIDLITLQQRLKDKNQLENVGGLSYLSSLPDAVPSAANLAYYADIVVEKYVLRKMIHTCTDVVARAYEHEGEVDALMDQVEKDILSIVESRVENGVQPIKSLVKDAVGLIQAMHENKGALTGVSTGFVDMDKMTGGLQKGDMIVIAARPSMGKAQPLDAKVLTPAGFVEMRQIQVGSEVIGGDGRPHKVLAVYPQGMKKVFRVTMTDKTSTRCCDEHLWFTQSRSERKRHIHGSVKNTKQLIETLTLEGGKRRNHLIHCVHPIEFGRKTSLPLDPWLLGALLGDGTLGGGNILFSKPELDMQGMVIAKLPVGDTAKKFTEMDLRIKGGKTRRIINELGLRCHSEGKFIPEQYLLASPLDRLELLRGLLDTDAHVGKNCSHAAFSSSSKRLADDVCFLVRSLGGIASMNSKIPTYTYKGEKKTGLRNYRIHIWFEDPSICPVTSQKHLAKWNPIAWRHCHRMIDSIEPDGEAECQCILIDSDDHLYVTDDFIVTHNTSLAMNIAEHASIESKIPVGVFSLEMTAQSLVMRMLCSYSRVNLRNIRDGFMSERDFPKLVAATGKLSSAPLFIDDTPGLSILQLRAKARRMHQQHGIKLFVIDYLQLLNSTAARSKENRQQEVADISSGIKALAKELQVPVIVLSQLNREFEKDKDRKPRLSDLRESGAIEQDADLIGLLYKPGRGDDAPVEETDVLPVNLLIAKQRNGPTGDVFLTFLKSFTRFENRAPEPQYAPPED